MTVETADSMVASEGWLCSMVVVVVVVVAVKVGVVAWVVAISFSLQENKNFRDLIRDRYFSNDD